MKHISDFAEKAPYIVFLVVLIVEFPLTVAVADFIFLIVPEHPRVILHIDIDCFYAQVEMIRNPGLRNKPIGMMYVLVYTPPREVILPRNSFLTFHDGL